MTLYKLTDKDGGPVHGGRGKWHLPSRGKPGKWREVDGKIVACQNGLHLMEPRDISRWIKWPAVLWVAEVEGERVRDSDKSVVRKARLVRRVTGYTEKALRLWAVDCAERVLPIYEKKYPNDPRVRSCIKATRGYLEKKITKKQLVEARNDAYAAARDAAALAAYAAYAAYADAAYAARAAAAAAARAAYADAAAYAAYAAHSTERAWQAKRLCELIRIGYEG